MKGITACSFGVKINIKEFTLTFFQVFLWACACHWYNEALALGQHDEDGKNEGIRRQEREACGESKRLHTYSQKRHPSVPWSWPQGEKVVHSGPWWRGEAANREGSYLSLKVQFNIDWTQHLGTVFKVISIVPLARIINVKHKKRLTKSGEVKVF